MPDLPEKIVLVLSTGNVALVTWIRDGESVAFSLGYADDPTEVEMQEAASALERTLQKLGVAGPETNFTRHPGVYYSQKEGRADMDRYLKGEPVRGPRVQ